MNIKDSFRRGLLVFTALLVVADASANQINKIRWGDGPNYVRIVLDMQEPAKYQWAMLENPHRFYMDLKDTSFSRSLEVPVIDGDTVGAIRLGLRPDNESRFVLELPNDEKPIVQKLGPSGSYGHRVVIDVKKDVVPMECSQSHSADVVIVIDAGHGGEDPGAPGIKNVHEKHITLAIAQYIKDEIEKQAGFNVVMTRDADFELRLESRRRVAEIEQADLFVSIHADAYKNAGPRGASVFVLGQGRAMTELAKWLETNENRSDWSGGVADRVDVDCLENPAELTFLNEKSQHEALAEAVNIGTRILESIDKVAFLHPKSYDAKSGGYLLTDAGFKVLKSLTVPSLLIETGFLSNPKEAELLITADYQRTMARAIGGEIRRYFCDNPPWHTDLEKGIIECVQPQVAEYRVRRGDTLSNIAGNYNISIAAIRQANGLANDQIMVGQRLVIPIQN